MNNKIIWVYFVRMVDYGVDKYFYEVSKVVIKLNFENSVY